MGVDYTWTDDPILDDTPVKAIHVNEIKRRIKERFDSIGSCTTFTSLCQSYSDPDVQAGDVITSDLLNKLKDDIQTIADQIGVTITWTGDFPLSTDTVIETHEHESGDADGVCSTDSTTQGDIIQIAELRRNMNIVGSLCTCDSDVCTGDCGCYGQCTCDGDCGCDGQCLNHSELEDTYYLCTCDRDCGCNVDCGCDTDCGCNGDCGTDTAGACGSDCGCNEDCSCNQDCGCNQDCSCDTYCSGDSLK